jgi:hypothetical protein
MTGELIEPSATVPTARNADTTLLDIIARAAADPNTDVDKLERLTALYERHMEREARAAFNAALAEMQPLLPEIAEHGEITDRQGEVQSTYALWEDIQAAIKPILARFGFSLNFKVAHQGDRLSVTGMLNHRLGHVEETTLPLPLDTSGNKNTVQSYGSSTSYGMRYTARALLNLTSRGEDDDGQAAGTKLISEGEIEALGLLMERAKVDPVRFCTFLKVPSLDQLPARRYRFAERALQDALQKRTQQRPPAGPVGKARDATSTTGGPAAGRSSTGRPGELSDLDHQDEVP